MMSRQRFPTLRVSSVKGYHFHMYTIGYACVCTPGVVKADNGLLHKGELPCADTVCPIVISHKLYEASLFTKDV